MLFETQGPTPKAIVPRGASYSTYQNSIFCEAMQILRV